MMALPKWPEGLNYKPARDSYAVTEPYQPPRVTEFEDGPHLMRKGSLQRRSKHKYEIDFLSQADFERFRVFAEVTLGNGSARFLMPVPTAAGYAEKTVQLDKGLYSTKQAGLGAQVSFTLIIYDW